MSEELPVHLPKSKKGLAIFGVAVVAVIVYVRFFRHTAASTGGVQTVPQSVTGQNNNPIPSVSGTGLGPSATSGSAAPSFYSNSSWEQAAESYLTGAGATPLAAQSALDTYLAGGNLNSQQQSWINSVLAKLGPSPSGVSTPNLQAPYGTDSSTHYVSFANSAQPDAIYAITGTGASYLDYAAWQKVGRPAPEVLTTSTPQWNLVQALGAIYSPAPVTATAPVYTNSGGSATAGPAVPPISTGTPASVGTGSASGNGQTVNPLPVGWTSGPAVGALGPAPVDHPVFRP